MVELAEKGDEVLLNNYAQFHAQAEYMSGRAGTFNLLDAQVARIIQSLMNEAQFTATTASISLPVYSSFSTLVKLPGMDEENLDQAVRFEARKFVPAPVGDVQLDWVKIDHLSTDENFVVLTVAVPNEIINKYRRVARMVGLTLGNLELETFSVARSLAPANPEPTLIIDMGARTTNAGIVDGGLVVIHHNIDMGGNTLTRALSRGMAVDGARAEELKQNVGISGSDEQVASLLKPTIDKLLLEMEQITQNYTRDWNKKIRRIILTGGGGKMPGMTEYLQENLRLPTEIGDPFVPVQVPDELRTALGKQATEFSVALGLTLRS